MRTMISVEILDYCTRRCLHCCNGARPNGRLMSRKDLIYVVELIKSRPKRSTIMPIDLNGELLLHPNLGEVLDLFHSNELSVGVLTRGFTSKEKSRQDLQYKNFRALINRIEAGYKIGVELSFDVYGFGGNKEQNLDALLCTIPELIDILSYVRVRMTLSPERKNETCELLMEAFRRRGLFGPRFDEDFARRNWGEILESILSNKDETLSRSLRIYGKRKNLVDITAGRLDGAGRAKNLYETYRRKIICDHFDAEIAPTFFIDPGLDIKYCCSYQTGNIPPFSNLHRNPSAILSDESKPSLDFANYLLAIEEMQKRFDKKGKGDICDYCVRVLPDCLKKTSRVL